MMTRRLLAVLASLSIAAGMLVGASTPAHAANLGTVTVSYSNFQYFVTPDSLTAAAGDTFTLANTRYNNSSSYVSLQNGTGAVALNGDACTANTTCPVTDVQGGTATGVFTVVSPGTVTVWRYLYSQGGSSTLTQIGTLTIGSGGSSATDPVTDPASVYPTAFLNTNGGTCTGTLQFTKYAGLNGTITLPTGDACTRTGYELANWTYTANGLPAPGTTWAPFAPGATVPIGDESFTLYAQWRPLGVEITYDLNVGMDYPCLANGTNTTVRKSVVVVEHPGSEYLRPTDGVLTANPACTPSGMVLAGWIVSSSGPFGKVYPPGTPVTDLFPGQQVSSAQIMLASSWTVSYAMTASPTQVSVATDGATSATFTATRNGAPAASVEVAVSATGNVTLGGERTSLLVTTRADGTVSVPIVGGAVGTGVVTAAYGDKTAGVQVTVEAPPTTQSILIIDGERAGERIETFGSSTGFKEGDILKPWIRFPGQTGFSEGTANILVDEDGDWNWGRKTGKRTAVQIRSEDGSVRSNTVVIEAR